MIAIVSFWRVTVVGALGAFWLLAVDQHGNRWVQAADAFVRDEDAWDLVDGYVGKWSPVGKLGWSEIPPGDACSPIDEFMHELIGV